MVPLNHFRVADYASRRRQSANFGQDATAHLVQWLVGLESAHLSDGHFQTGQLSEWIPHGTGCDGVQVDTHEPTGKRL